MQDGTKSKTFETAARLAQSIPNLSGMQKAAAQAAAMSKAFSAPVKKEAELVTQSKAFQSVQSIPASVYSTAELVARYARFVDASPLTVKAYLKALRYWQEWLKAQEVQHPTREDVLAYRNHLAETRKPSTSQLYLSGIRLFYRWTASEGFYPNITDNVKSPKRTTEHKRDHLTAAQIKAVLSQVNRSTIAGKRDYALLVLAACCGLRAVELAEADIEDLRPQAGDMVLFLRGKGRSEKSASVRVPEPVEAAIREYLAARPDSSDKAPLFAATGNRNGGGRMDTASISRLAKKYFRAAGFNSSRLTLHSLRHSAVTLALQAGRPLDEVQAFARHSSITTTLIYSHALDAAQNKASRAVADTIF